ncbi:7002_t:CDS:2, partial [Gigaspora margarita]
MSFLNVIRNCQTVNLNPDTIVEWIPFENFKDIKFKTEGGFGPITIVLKSLDDFIKLNDENLEEVTSNIISNLGYDKYTEDKIIYLLSSNYKSNSIEDNDKNSEYVQNKSDNLFGLELLQHDLNKNLQENLETIKELLNSLFQVLNIKALDSSSQASNFTN